MLKNFKVWRLFLCAMQEEADPIIKHYNLLKVDNSSIRMFPLIEKNMFGIAFQKICDKINIYVGGSRSDIVLIVTGIGKVNAALTTSYALSIMNVTEVINIGMCGSLKPDLHKQGQIVLVKEVFQHDAYIPLKGIQFEYLMDKIDLEIDISKTISHDVLEFNEVTLATGDLFIDDQELFDELSEVSDIVDMEGYAIARTCQMYSTKLRMYKMVSDSSNKESAVDFKKSFEMYIYEEKIKNLLTRI